MVDDLRFLEKFDVGIYNLFYEYALIFKFFNKEFNYKIDEES